MSDVTVTVTDSSGNAASSVASYAITSDGTLPGWGAPVWRDEFDGTAVDRSRWNVRSDWQGNHGGKNEPANATVAAGVLSLTCRRLATPFVTPQGVVKPFGTAYLDTNGKAPAPVARGRWAVRMRLPRAKGSWLAFWLRDAALPGELDVVEAVCDGLGGGRLVFTVHQDTNGGKAKRGFEWVPPASFDWQGYHEYAVEWDGVRMSWLVDGVVITSITSAAYPWLSTSFGPAGLNMRLNYQAGGSMPDYYHLPMDTSSALPDRFDVDWVRVHVRPAA